MCEKINNINCHVDKLQINAHICNQDHDPISIDINVYLESMCHTKYLRDLYVFPDENYLWKLHVIDKDIEVSTDQEKQEIKLLLSLLKKYLQ